VTNTVATSLTIYTNPITISIEVPYPSTYSLSNTVVFPALTNPKDYNTSDYRIIGLPGGSNQLISTYLTGTQATDWEVYWDNGADSNYLSNFSSGSTNFNCTAGRAFWLINKGTWTLNTTVNTAALNANDEVEIIVHNGWNLITNPFIQSISWSAIQTYNDTITEPIHSYNGSYTTSTNFTPYSGYYFFKY
jgi:hypothetical protein